MTPDDWRRVDDRRGPWQEATLHDLRIRYAALLLDVTEHRRALNGLDVHDADRRLWSVLDERESDGLGNEPQVVGGEGVADVTAFADPDSRPEGPAGAAADEGVAGRGGPARGEA